jgi:hypothetical protein
MDLGNSLSGLVAVVGAGILMYIVYQKIRGSNLFPTTPKPKINTSGGKFIDFE